MYFSIGESTPRKHKIGAEAIKWFEGTNHSHVFISWKDSKGLRWVAEAKGSGVRMLSNIEFKKHARIMNIYHYSTNRAGVDKIVDYTWGQLAKSYGYKQIYGLAEMRVLNKIYRVLGLKKKARNRFTDGDSSQICCEFVLRCAEIALGKNLEVKDLEQWGLIETQAFNNAYGKKQSKELIDRINGVL